MVCEYDIIPMHSKQERYGWAASILYAVPSVQRQAPTHMSPDRLEVGARGMPRDPLPHPLPRQRGRGASFLEIT